LIPKKGTHLIIQAIAGMEQAKQPDLVIVGDGPERERLEELVSQNKLEASVRFIGFAEPEDMVGWYVAADIFVLPSSETWGVVVSEALAAGLPVLVSDQVGCHPDMVGEVEVGEVIPRQDIAAWSMSIARLIQKNIEADAIERNWTAVFERMRYVSVAHMMLTNLQVCAHMTKPARVRLAQ
jgi:glycosyltransferase involved in cell wall biosynthesis